MVKVLSLHSLTLYAREAGARLDHAELVAILQSFGLLGARLEPQAFLTGARLFEHISFLGCAPNIPLNPEESTHFLRITIPILDGPQLFTAINTRTPICHSCRTPLKSWRSRFEAGKTGIQCPACREWSAASDIKLGKQACFSRNLIQISPIFEGEAIPTHRLLQQLGEQMNTPFAYAYTRQVAS